VRIEAMPNPQAKAQAAAQLHARLLALRNLSNAHAPGGVAAGADASLPGRMRAMGERFGRSEPQVGNDLQTLLRTGEHPPGVHPDSPYGQALLRMGERLAGPRRAPAVVEPAAPREPAARTPEITTRQGAPERGTLPDGTLEPLGKRHNLTAPQRRYFAERRKAAEAAQAAGDVHAMDQFRFERTQASRRNRGLDPFPDIEAWRSFVTSRNTAGNRTGGTAVGSRAVSGVGEHFGRRMQSGDSLPKIGADNQPVVTRRGRQVTTKYEVDVPGVGPTNRTVRTRPDGISVDAHGRPDPTGVVHDNKHFSSSETRQVYNDTTQLQAQRALAQRNGGRHVVSMSSDVPNLSGVPPSPRPNPALSGSGSTMVYVDPGSGRVTHQWNHKTQAWDPVTAGAAP
jgi:hypothetical protein